MRNSRVSILSVDEGLVTTEGCCMGAPESRLRVVTFDSVGNGRVFRCVSAEFYLRRPCSLLRSERTTVSVEVVSSPSTRLMPRTVAAPAVRRRHP